MSFWDILWVIFVSFALVAYLMVMFSIIADLFRDRGTSGFIKAVWMIALIFLPFLTAFLYVIARGRGMAERSMSSAEAMKQAQDAYIRETAGKTTPADQIAQARAMLDSGVISRPEYDRLKEKALV
ncbi:MAG: SHOCT domain-containing protein [Nocardioides sp.]|nr:SHOCT domain-containing protein [Nocardioides sp.]